MCVLQTQDPGGGHKLDMTCNLHPWRLAFMVPENAMQASKLEKQPRVLPSYKQWWSAWDCIYGYSSNAHILEITNISLIEPKVCSTRGKLHLVLEASGAMDLRGQRISLKQRWQRMPWFHQGPWIDNHTHISILKIYVHVSKIYLKISKGFCKRYFPEH